MYVQKGGEKNPNLSGHLRIAYYNFFDKLDHLQLAQKLQEVEKVYVP